MEVLYGLKIGLYISFFMIIYLLLPTNIKFFTWYKLMIYSLLILIIFNTMSIIHINTGLYTTFCGVCLLFIQKRISDFIRIVGIVNSIMFNYLNGKFEYILKSDSGELKRYIFGFSHKHPSNISQNKKDYIMQDIDKSLSEIVKIQIYDNEIIYFLHKLKLEYEIHFNQNSKLQCSIETHLKFTKLNRTGFSSSKLIFDRYLIKEIIKIF